MIIVVPSCLKDANGARTRSDQFEYIWILVTDWTLYLSNVIERCVFQMLRCLVMISLIAEEDYSLVDQRLGWEAHSFDINIKHNIVPSKTSQYVL